MNNNTDITYEHVDALLLAFATRMYDASDSEDPRSFSHGVIDRCAALFNLDYNVMEIANRKGDLTPNYPSRLLVPESEHAPAAGPSTTSTTTCGQPQTIYEHSIDATRLRQHWQDARLARCRARFPVPVILYRGKFICRSATLSGYAEMYGRATLESFMSLAGESPTSAQARRAAAAAAAVVAAVEAEGDDGEDVANELIESGVAKNMTYIDATRSNDIRLLKYLNVSVIADLMVEMKKVKYGLNVSSSEKVDKEKRYARFHLAAMPYPGCEFFKNYRDNSHSPQTIYYNWSDEFNNADISIGDIHLHQSFNGTMPAPAASTTVTPSGVVAASANTPTASGSNANNGTNGTAANGQTKYVPLDIRWNDYQAWDLKTLTLNYLRSCLHNIRYSNSGMLVHCISGWDRTPLFVSLLRITLWADGVIHQSLSPLQMLYLTVAYDWYLFGHNLPDRLYKGEDIFFFCFNMLKYMHVRELCTVTPKPTRSKHNSCSSGSGSGGGTKTDIGEQANTSGDLNGMIFEEDELDGNDEENRSLNQMCYPDPNFESSYRNGNGLRAKRDRTYSGRSSNSDQQTIDGGSMESLFADIQLNEHLNRSSSPEESTAAAVATGATTTSPHGHYANNAKTSPMSVPRVPRQRNESTSSAGSWQMVTTTGSYKTSESFMGSHASSMAGAAAAHRDGHTDVNGVVIFEDDPMYEILLMRSKRLKSLREEFYLRYWATVGRSKSHGPLGAFINSFVGKVGLVTKAL